MQEQKNQNTRTYKPSWVFTEMTGKGNNHIGILTNGEIELLKAKTVNLTEEEVNILITTNSRIGKTVITLEVYIEGELLSGKFYIQEQQNN